MSHYKMNREYVTERFTNLYLQGKTALEISVETGYSVNTVKQYLSRAGVKKEDVTAAKERREARAAKYEKEKRIKKETEQIVPEEIIEETSELLNQDKPYIEIDQDFVLYKGRVYEKLSKERLRELLLEPMTGTKTKSKKKGKKKKNARNHSNREIFEC